MKRLIAAVLAVAALAAAQETKKPVESGPVVQKIFQIKHANVNALANILSNIVQVNGDSRLGVLSVKGSPEAVAAVEDALKRLDVPQPPNKNVELVFQMIMARPGKDGSLPAELASVQRNLESLFGFKGFHLMETSILRARDGNGVESSGVLPNPAVPPIDAKMTYSLRATPEVNAAASANVVRIDGLRLDLEIPYLVAGGGISSRRARINTQVDVKEGQKVVVGKANVDGSDGALILVVTAKVVE